MVPQICALSLRSPMKPFYFFHVYLPTQFKDFKTNNRLRWNLFCILLPHKDFCDKCVVFKVFATKICALSPRSLLKPFHVVLWCLPFYPNSKTAKQTNNGLRWNLFSSLWCLPFIHTSMKVVITHLVLRSNTSFFSVKSKEIREGKGGSMKDPYYSTKGFWVAFTFPLLLPPCQQSRTPFVDTP